MLHNFYSYEIVNENDNSVETQYLTANNDDDALIKVNAIKNDLNIAYSGIYSVKNVQKVQESDFSF